MKDEQFRKAGIATLKEPASKTVANHLDGKPTRFYYEGEPPDFVPVAFGHPRYDDAPYEMTVKTKSNYRSQLSR